MPTRRHFLGHLGMAPLFPSLIEPFTQAAPPEGDPDSIARNESYWREIQSAFTVDRSLIHLNNGGVCPTPQCVQRVIEDHQSYAYNVPFYMHRRTLKPQWERVRKGIAHAFGCSSEEIALTRNTSEGMETCQMGIDLEAGDEIVTTDQDYPRMLNTWNQRIQRDRIALKQIPLPVPMENTESLLDAFRAHITPRTRLIMVCHMVDLTGQLLPVKEIAMLGKEHGIPVLVDGAQTFGQIDFTYEDLQCDFFATSLHKWLMGPPGTGFLFVKQPHISSLWPLMPAEEELKADIRKFEDVGTQSMSRFIAISEALAFHNRIGIAHKEARLRYLRQCWQDELIPLDRIRLHTSTHSAFSASLATFEIEGIDSTLLRDYLWNTHRIVVRPINHPAVQGIRVSPGLQTTLRELSQFTDVIKHVIQFGIPS
ncbi:MAG: aminotransferase class V-fold PLP-dependent enzyme [Rhodothermaceae bacterium]|nr:aminotransferase class V-fold PLP-dependent enzyme [Rhodothermaceae bacterium]